MKGRKTLPNCTENAGRWSRSLDEAGNGEENAEVDGELHPSGCFVLGRFENE